MDAGAAGVPIAPAVASLQLPSHGPFDPTVQLLVAMMQQQQVQQQAQQQQFHQLIAQQTQLIAMFANQANIAKVRALWSVQMW
jgi:hypothetical protein